LPAQPAKSPRGLLTRIAPWIIFALLTALTGVVWHEEISTQRHLLQRHTDDVTMQGARRLEMFIGSRLTAAQLVARRWASHERHDYSRTRFEGLAQVLIAELPGVRAVELLTPGLDRSWRVGGDRRVQDSSVSASVRALVTEARAAKTPVLSAPQRSAGRHYHVAVLPPRPDAEMHGLMLVELDTTLLIDACFLQRIRNEFSFNIHDGTEPIYLHGAEATSARRGQANLWASATMPVANRTWTMVVAPIAAQARLGGWRASLPVPVLGLALSVALALLVHQLGRRMEMYRSAHDRAMRENEQRRQAEAELRVSEARYRSIFDSASDGFLVTSREGRILDVNPAAATMHGYSIGELRGRPLSDLIAPSGSSETLEVLRILAEHGPVRIESQDRRKDGSSLDVEVRGGQLNYDGSPAILAMITDVTERRLAVQRHALLARKVLVAQEEERARIARELHDELGQLLTALRLELDWVRKRGARAGQDGQVGFGNAFELVEKAAAELRRICRGLRPPLLDDLGVDPAVRLLVNEFKEHSGIPVTLEIRTDSAGTVSSELALCVYRILQESLTNVSRHAGASKVEARLSILGSELLLSVSDDGKGFDPDHTGEGSGVAGMRERANLVNGKLSIVSERGQGTRLEFRAPLPATPQKEGG
jgi:two-component system, NarL family, sensor histidine kinase UhpB